MTITMSEGGEKIAVVETPTYVFAPSSNQALSNESKKGIKKEHILAVVGLVVLSGLIITGILVGMYIFAEAQKDIVKFSVNFKSTTDGKEVKQEVESDPNDNVVMYHITKDGKNVDIVNDFNRGMQIVKMEMMYGTNCFISALNRSAAVDPSNINGLQSGSNDKSAAEVFSVSTSPVTDRSFLPKKAQAMCEGVSVYWAYRSCNNQRTEMSNLNNTSGNDRGRRAVYLAGNYQGLPCLNGCCWTVCSCQVQVTETVTGCQFYYVSGTCCGLVAQPYCANTYMVKQATPGKTCTY